MKRRIKGFILGESMFSTLLRHGATVRCMAGIPDDARFCGANFDYQRRAFVVAFEHPRFDEVEEGVEIPLTYAGFEVLEDPAGKARGHVFDYLAADQGTLRILP